jgi:hypothetical protein
MSITATVDSTDKAPQSLKQQEGVKSLAREIQGFLAQQQIYYRINDDIRLGNIEYVVGENLAAGMSLSGTLEARAIDFVRSKSELFNLPKRQAQSNMFVKYVLRSLMGTHIILGFRYKGRDDTAGQEELDKSFAVHFSDDERLVMISSVYLPCGQDLEEDPWTDAERKKLTQALAEIQQGKFSFKQGVFTKEDTPQYEGIPREVRVEQKWITEQTPTSCKMVLRFQVKFTTGNMSLVFLLDKSGNYVSCYSTSSGAFLRTSQVALDLWGDSVQDPKGSVILRDLIREDEVRGRYVWVQDNVPPPEIMSWKVDSALSSSGADRVMAYYHVDYIQRYFRELGLRALDDYDGLNPLRIELCDSLQRSARTQFLPGRQAIILAAVEDAQQGALKCTDARSARLIYHECVHAITDAIARLRRDNAATLNTLRFKQILQAHAMDEGLADYFACSVLARQGVKDANFIAPLKIHDSRLVYDLNSAVTRDLEGDRPFPCQGLIGKANLSVDTMKFKDMGNGSIDENVIYALGLEWSRLLLRIRTLLGPEIADMLIANSIFFLTRWSTFGMGVRALVLTDRLLFGGVHEEDILEKADGKMACDWKIEPEERGGTAASPEFLPDVTGILRPDRRQTPDKSAYQQATAD